MAEEEDRDPIGQAAPEKAAQAPPPLPAATTIPEQAGAVKISETSKEPKFGLEVKEKSKCKLLVCF